MAWLDRAPWIAGGLSITRGALEAVEREAIRGYLAGEEACGYLTGPADVPLLCDAAVRVDNLARLLHERDPLTYFRSPRTFFAFSERVLDEAVRVGDERGRPVKVLFHSHLDVGAYFSATDAAVLSGGSPPLREGMPATLGPGPRWPIAFMVSSVRGGEASPIVDDHKLFVWNKRSFEASELLVLEQG